MREIDRLKTVEVELSNLLVKLIMGEAAEGLKPAEIKQLVMFLLDLRNDLKKQIAEKEK